MLRPSSLSASITAEALPPAAATKVGPQSTLCIIAVLSRPEEFKRIRQNIGFASAVQMGYVDTKKSTSCGV